MALTLPSSSKSNIQKMVIGYLFLIIGLSSILLFARSNLLYVLIGFFTLAGIVWAQFDSKRWLYLAIIAMPMSPTVAIWHLKAQVSTELSDSVAIAACVVWGVNLLINKTKRKGYDAYVFGWLVLYVLFAILSSFAGYYHHWVGVLILNALGHLGKWVSYVLLFYIIYTMSNDDEDIKNVLRAVLIGFVIGSSYSIGNYMLYRGAYFVKTGSDIYRSVGLMKGINGYGVTLAVVLIFFFNLIIQGKAKEIFPTWIVVAACSYILIALVVTFSRTGWVTLFGGMALICFFRGRPVLGALIILMTLAGFLLLGRPVQDRFSETFEEKPENRLPIDMAGREGIWIAALEHLNDSGFWGVGYGNYGQTVFGTEAHNGYIEIAGESGFFGLVTFMIFYWRWFRAELFLYRKHPVPFYKECAYGNMVCIGIVAVAAFAGEFFYFPSVIALLAIFYGTARTSFEMELDKVREIAASKTIRPVRYNLKLGT